MIYFDSEVDIYKPSRIVSEVVSFIIDVYIGYIL